MQHPGESKSNARALLDKLKAFVLPCGEDAARLVNRVRLKEKGEICSSPGARWIPFTAEETIEARRSGFVWEARMRAGKLLPMVVTDAYEQGHGRLAVKVGGALPIVNSHGPEYDKGELQRYLGGVGLCPPMLAAHPTLEWTAINSRTLRVRDTEDPTGAVVDFDVGEDGRPLVFRANRHRAVGKTAVETPWSGIANDFREQDGFRVATRVEASWHLTGGMFTYYRAEVTSFVAER